jgi:LEA14-like dessication related protein
MSKFYRAYGLIFTLFCAALLTACTALQPRLEEPVVKVTRLQLLPSQGLQQRIGVGLLISNPNARDLSLNGISYTIGIEKFSVLSGVSNQVPVLKAYQETPVDLEVSANLLEIVRLIEYFSRNTLQESVNYNFDAKLDFSHWLPTMRVKETGKIPLVR